jgi:hypothetical protein
MDRVSGTQPVRSSMTQPVGHHDGSEPPNDPSLRGSDWQGVLPLPSGSYIVPRSAAATPSTQVEEREANATGQAPATTSTDSTRTYAADLFANLIRAAHELPSPDSAPAQKRANDATSERRPAPPVSLDASPNGDLAVPHLDTTSAPVAASAGSAEVLVGSAGNHLQSSFTRAASRYLGGILLACSVVSIGLVVSAYRAELAWLLAGQPEAASPPATSVVSAPQRIKINVEIVPAGARLFLDGAPASNPLQLSYPADEALHEIRAEAVGFQPRTIQVSFRSDVFVVLALATAAKP